MGKMISVINGNVQLNIDEDKKDYYLGRGYCVIDENGSIIEYSVTDNVDSLKKEIARLKELLEERDKEIIALKKKPATKKQEQ